MSNTAAKNIFGLIAFVVIVAAAALVAGSFPPGEWYAGLAKPDLTPPSWVFGAVWPVLYLLMAVSGWLGWKKSGIKKGKIPLVLFLAQLALNAGWTWIFFGLRQPGLAFAEIILLLAAILAVTVSFWRIKRTAGLLFLPYLAWVLFAAFLNYRIWILNR